MTRHMISYFAVFAILLTGATARAALCCPFCSAQAQTLTEDITTMDAVVIARMEVPPPRAKDGDDEVPKAKFKIVDVVKGQSLLAKTTLLETIYFGEATKGTMFLVMAVGPENLVWSTPLRIGDRAQAYIKQLSKLPKEGPDRLAFFQEYLQDSDDLLARDAFDEFAKAPYGTVKGLKDRMKHDKLVAWIKDGEVPASRRRLYLTMLGVCGGERDVPMLEEMLQSSDRRQKAGLDALIACYLILKGPAGMPLVEELFLINPKAEYADTYAAIMALRFHGTDTTVISKDRLLQGFRHMLKRPQLADLVIPDLARWEDWSCMDQLVDLFKNADDKSSWVKVPVVNYLRACPLPKAKDHIKELEILDPESVKRALNFFPSPTGNTSAASKS